MNKKIIMVALIMVIILSLCLGIFLVTRINQGNSPNTEVSEYTFNEQYSNLRENTGIVKYQLVVQYATGEETEKMIEKNKTAIINNMTEIMRTKSSEELAQANSMSRLRTQLQDMIIEQLESDDSVITNVYFLQYVIQ